MSKIHVLSEELINKIAAGEVIERPASVVKELIENAIDAGATVVKVVVKESGKKLISIADNGMGMDEADARKALLAHATSKIASYDDLLAVSTLGFRGEALASIAAVSRLSIITKTAEGLAGVNVLADAGRIVNVLPIGAERGTTIEVHDLFYNTPARRKFLKTDPVELRHIVDVVLSYALVRTDVSFSLYHENHELVNAPQVLDGRARLAAIYGLQTARDLLEVKYEREGIGVLGYISKPHDCRNDKSSQTLFINGRLVRNNDLVKAVYGGYHSTLFVNKHPLLVLHLTLDPLSVDVNVHPQKTEVKIEQRDVVEGVLTTAVRQALQANNLIPVLDFKSEDQRTLVLESPVLKEGSSLLKPVKSLFKSAGPKEVSQYLFEQSDQRILAVHEEIAPFPASRAIHTDLNSDLSNPGYFGSSMSKSVTSMTSVFDNDDNKAIPADEQNVTSLRVDLRPQTTHEAVSEGSVLPAMRILGQIHKTFFVAETAGGVLFIDQHVVEERVLYEKFMKQYFDSAIAVQTLLRGEVLDLTPMQRAVIAEKQESLASFGFIVEPFGGGSFVLKSVPLLFGRMQPKELLYSILEDGAGNLLERKEDIITRMACRASVKAGDSLTIPEIQKLLGELVKCDLPYTCPHGRSILIKMTADELEKKFKRK